MWSSPAPRDSHESLESAALISKPRTSIDRQAGKKPHERLRDLRVVASRFLGGRPACGFCQGPIAATNSSLRSTRQPFAMSAKRSSVTTAFAPSIRRSACTLHPIASHARSCDQPRADRTRRTLVATRRRASVDVDSAIRAPSSRARLPRNRHCGDRFLVR